MIPRTFPISAGLLEHKKWMGAAVWEYLWLLDRVTSDEPDGKGEFSGIVAGGHPVSTETIAHDLRESFETAKANLRKLAEEGYVERKRAAGCGYSYLVTKSKKWIWKRSNGIRTENTTVTETHEGQVENYLRSGRKLPEAVGEETTRGSGRKPPQGQVENQPDNKEVRELRQKNNNSSSPDGEVEPRHSPIRALVQQLHLKQFRVMCPWDGSEGKALSVLLASNPSWTEEQIARMVRNRFTSEAINSARPRKWLSNLSEYAAGPLDRYGKLRTNGNGTNRAEQRQASNLAACEEAKAALRKPTTTALAVNSGGVH